MEIKFLKIYKKIFISFFLVKKLFCEISEFLRKKNFLSGKSEECAKIPVLQ